MSKQSSKYDKTKTNEQLNQNKKEAIKAAKELGYSSVLIDILEDLEKAESIAEINTIMTTARERT